MCHTYEDVWWCVFRSWLELAVDTELISRGSEEARARAGRIWPPPDLRRGLPDTVAQALDRVRDKWAARGGPDAAGGSAAAQRFREMQQLLIRGAVAGADPADGTSLLGLLLASAMAVVAAVKARAPEGPQPVPWGFLRFATHVYTLMDRLVPGGVPPEAYDRAVSGYAAHLIDSGRLDLAPLYLALVKSPLFRRDQFVVFLDHEGTDLEDERDRAHLFAQVAHVLAMFPAPGCCATDVLVRLVQMARRSLINGRLRKIRALRWLLLEDQASMALLQHLNLLARDLAVFGSTGSADPGPSLKQVQAALFLGPSSVFAEVGGEDLPQDDPVARESVQWWYHAQWQRALDSFLALHNISFDAARAGGPSEDEIAKLRRAGEAALEAADAILHEGWMSGGTMAVAELEGAAMQLAIVGLPPSLVSRSSASMPSLVLVPASQVTDMAEELQRHMERATKDMQVTIAVSSFDDINLVGSSAVRVSITAQVSLCSLRYWQCRKLDLFPHKLLSLTKAKQGCAGSMEEILEAARLLLEGSEGSFEGLRPLFVDATHDPLSRGESPTCKRIK